MASVNKVILIGNLGKDPEVRFTPGGQAVANFSIATSDSWTDKSGQKQERTEWHRIVVWGKLAEISGEYLKKGRQSTSRVACRRASGRTRTAPRSTPPRSSPRRCRCSAAARAWAAAGTTPAMAAVAAAAVAATSVRRRRRVRPARPKPAAKSSTGFDNMDDDIPF